MGSITRSVCGISAAAIMAILTGKASAEITTPNYSTGFDGTGTSHAASTILGGTVFNFNGSSSDWAGNPVYVLVRSSDTNKAVTLSSTCAPYKDGSIAGSGSFSFNTVAQLAATEVPMPIASVSAASHTAGNTGLTLVYQSGHVKLLNWKKDTGVSVLVDAEVTGAETAFHSYLVTLAKGEGETPSTVKLFVDGVQVGSDETAVYEPGVNGYQIGGIFGGTDRISIGDTACTKAVGFLVDDAAIWQSDVSAQASEIAAKFPEWTATTSEITLAPGAVNWADVDKPETLGDTVTITLSGDTTLTLGEAVAFRNLVLKGTGTLMIADSDNVTVGTLAKEGTTDFGLVIDATAGVSASEKVKGFIQNTNYKIVIKGEGEKGLTVDFGKEANWVLNSHLVFEGGKHTFKYGHGYDGRGTNFGAGATDDNPTLWVKGGATVDFVAKDLTGWTSNHNDGGVIRVDNGGTLNITSYDSGTIYYSQRLYLEPGATVSVPDNDKFRLYGGTGGHLVIVPAGEGQVNFSGRINLESDIKMHLTGTLALSGTVSANSKVLQQDNGGKISGLKINGNCTLKPTNKGLDGLEILSGTTTITQGDRALLGTTTIAKNATLKLDNNDIFGYENVATLDIKGTLDLDDNRQTVKNPGQGLNTIIIHPGAQITGRMPQTDDPSTEEVEPTVTVNGGCHLNVFQDTVFKMVKDEGEEGETATISAILGPQGAAGMTADIAAGLTLEITATSPSTGSGRRDLINKTGDGTLKIASGADISSLASLTLTGGTLVVANDATIPSAGVTGATAYADVTGARVYATSANKCATYEAGWAGKLVFVGTNVTGANDFGAKASIYGAATEIEIAEGAVVSGYFPANATTCPLTINGTFKVVDGYTDRPATIPTLAGTGKIVDAIVASGKTARPTVKVQDWTNWSKDQVELPAENAKLNMVYSVAKSNEGYYYTTDEIKNAINTTNPAIKNISLTAEELAAAELRVDDTGVITKLPPAVTQEELDFSIQSLSVKVLDAALQGAKVARFLTLEGVTYTIVGATTVEGLAAEGAVQTTTDGTGLPTELALPVVPDADGQAFYKVKATSGQ